jgi:hypothetical protein
VVVDCIQLEQQEMEEDIQLEKNAMLSVGALSLRLLKTRGHQA